ncbi:MAG TPA: ABC transporter substrate-binding protein [Caldilineaceae bacterium]|nr:ABC transporter substrate-binding protein [Caldilineaceae bacterium]
MKPMRTIYLPTLLTLIILLAACVAPTADSVAATDAKTSDAETTSSVATAPETNITDSCADNYNAEIDYFPTKVELTHTDGFSVDYHNNYKVVTVNTPWPGAESALEYVLVQCGTPAPDGYDATQIIDVPVQSIATMSTSYLPFLDSLGVMDRLVAVDDVTYVNNATVLEMAEAGELAQIGYGAGVNVEQLLDLSPDLIMTYGSGSPDYDAHPVLLNAGLHAVVNAEWLETSPLGRAEWGKFIALFFNKEAQAEADFAATVKRYEALAAQATAVEDKPTVLTDSEYQGSWYVAGGNSFTAQYLADAGADYLWADDESTGSIPLAFEAVYDRAAAADYWVNVGFFNSLAEFEAADARYADFAPFQNGNIWNNNKTQNANGGNDYYESAVANPDVVLADLISIFHPELLPAHETVYFQQMQ